MRLEVLSSDKVSTCLAFEIYGKQYSYHGTVELVEDLKLGAQVLVEQTPQQLHRGQP